MLFRVTKPHILPAAASFSPTLRRALDIARQSFTSLWFADHFMFGDAGIHEAIWREEQASFHGKYYQIDQARCEPCPNPPPVIMIGDDGEQLTLRAVARHADWWNCYSQTPAVARRKVEALKQHCAAEGRDFASFRKTWSGPVIIDRSHQAALKRAGDALQQTKPPIVGDPSAVAERIQELAELGFDLFQVGFDQFPDTTDMELFIAEVMPRCGR